MSELMSPAAAEEYSQALRMIGEGWWRQIAWAAQQGIPQALGMSTREWAEEYHGYIKMPIPERKAAVAELAAEGLTQPQIADVLGVGQATVSRDLSPEPDIQMDTPEPEAAEPEREIIGSPEPDIQMDTPEPEAAEPEGIDEPEAPTEPEVEPEPAVELTPLRRGWHDLGPHRLYCGDSTDGEFVVACEGASFAFADPPYNTNKAEWDQGFEWKHDYLAESAEIVAVTPGIAALAGFLARTEMPYKWSMAAEITNGMTSGALRFGNWICVTLFAHGSIYRKSKDHVRIPAATGDDAGGTHASRKPIRLLTHLIELFTTKGDTVVDPFLGSGTTLIAADRTGRRCIGAEIDPMHCAQIVARYNEQASSA